MLYRVNFFIAISVSILMHYLLLLSICKVNLRESNSGYVNNLILIEFEPTHQLKQPGNIEPAITHGKFSTNDNFLSDESVMYADILSADIYKIISNNKLRLKDNALFIDALIYISNEGRVTYVAIQDNTLNKKINDCLMNKKVTPPPANEDGAYIIRLELG